MSQKFYIYTVFQVEKFMHMEGISIFQLFFYCWKVDDCWLVLVVQVAPLEGTLRQINRVNS